MWVSGFLQSAGLAGSLNALSEVLGFVWFLGLGAAAVAWLMQRPSRGIEHGAD